MRMMAMRALEAQTGVLAVVAGAAGIEYLATSQMYAGESCQASSPAQQAICTPGTATLLQINDGTAVFDLGVAGLLMLAIGIGAVWHSWRGARRARQVLWVATALLGVFATLGIFTIGMPLMPSVAAGIVASVCSLAWDGAAQA
jgi:hypothetical protein